VKKRDFDCVAALRALGEVNRLQIMRIMVRGGSNVRELVETLHLAQPNVSLHLRVLRRAGLIEATVKGRERFYVLSPPFRKRLLNEQQILDLGCCQFDFRKLTR
jgi:DNA-binding transcriptional ArsR family regulator